MGKAAETLQAMAQGLASVAGRAAGHAAWYLRHHMQGAPRDPRR